jgi:acyl-CoA synthetase (AMP-forming)/AMP-acid ligase II
MTETSPVTLHMMKGYTNYDSVGVPVPNTEIKIMHTETKTSLAQGEQGEICVRGPQARNESFKSSTYPIQSFCSVFSHNLTYSASDSYLSLYRCLATV